MPHHVLSPPCEMLAGCFTGVIATHPLALPSCTKHVQRTFSDTLTQVTSREHTALAHFAGGRTRTLSQLLSLMATKLRLLKSPWSFWPWPGSILKAPRCARPALASALPSTVFLTKA